MWGSNCGDAGAENVCAEYSADLGIFAAEQFAAVYRQSRVACSERLFKPQTRAKPSAEKHLQQAVQPQAALTAAAQASSAIQQSESHDRQSNGHVPASASVPVPGASSRPSLVSATSSTSFIPKLQLQPQIDVAASSQPPRVRIIMKPNTHGHSQVLQPVGRTPAQASAAAPICTLTTKMDNSKSGLARGKKRHRAEHSLTEQQQVEETPLEDPDTPDLEELPPQAFKRRKKEQRDLSIEGGRVKIGDVVWAKCGNHPWWPAQVTPHVSAPRKRVTIPVPIFTLCCSSICMMRSFQPRWYSVQPCGAVHELITDQSVDSCLCTRPVTNSINLYGEGHTQDVCTHYVYHSCCCRSLLPQHQG